MAECTPEQLRFPSFGGVTMRADFDVGVLPSDFGALLRRGVDRQIGLTRHLAEAFDDRRRLAYTTHSVQVLFAHCQQLSLNVQPENSGNR